MNIDKAVDILRAGGVVAFPTETVYGLGADARSPVALQKIFSIKERPSNHPLIVHIAHLSQLADWACDISKQAFEVANFFWPGPLTLILKKKPHVLNSITGGQDTIGLRIPSQPIAQALLQHFGDGIAAPSANKYTHLSPTTASAVYAELGETVDFVLDGGECALGLESTILDMSGDEPVLLRPGMITREALTAVLGKPIANQAQKTSIRVSGMHHLHYAPVTQTILLDEYAIPEYIESLAQHQYPIAVVTHSNVSISIQPEIKHITLSSQPSVYAHDIYHVLRELDHACVRSILIESVPMSAEWDAIRDRVMKATARR